MSETSAIVLCVAFVIAQSTAILFGFAWWAAQRERHELWDEIYRRDCADTGEPT